MTDMEQVDNSRTLKNLQNPVLDENKNKSEYVSQWISQAEFDDSTSEASSFVYSSSVVESETYLEDMKNMNLEDTTDSSLENSINKNGIMQKMDVLQQVFNTKNNVQTFGTVNIEKAAGPVHIGNVTYITGPIHITDTRGGPIGVINQVGGDDIKLTSHSSNDHNYVQQNVRIAGEDISQKSVPSQKRQPPTLNLVVDDQIEEEEREEINNIDAFVGDINRNIIVNNLHIIQRRTWLAQVPLEPHTYLEGPASYVIISHTGTELTRTQAESVYLVRHIQCFHIESCRWNDIGYNFLIGGDGNVYEGRGWGVVGAHTRGYNKKGIGISFIGCFMRELPPRESLSACKLLIKRGVELGYIDANYKLLAHCQCYPTESPGKRLFEEIKMWPHFIEIV